MNRFKIAAGLLIGGFLLVSGVALALANNSAGQRVYVFTTNPAARTMLGVNHRFPGVFSTEVSPRLKALQSLGLIKTQPVQLYRITDKPVCNDGVCQGNEPRTCPQDCSPEPAPAPTCFPDNQYPWGIQRVNGGTGGVGVEVAVLDTGVYKGHPDLQANVIDCKDTTKRGIKNGCADRYGHGTHVSGTILADGGSGLGIYGVAPEAKLMAIKVCGNSGSCWGDDIAAGIRYAADNGANVISMSLGGDTPDSQILSAVDYAVAKDVLVVAAAGNDGPADGSIDYPAAYYKVVAAGAIDSTEAVPDWSSRGVNDGDYVVGEKEVEFGTPGVDVESTYKDGCYTYMSGTSMATPHVSGLAAKLWQGSAEDTRNYLHDLAKKHDIFPSGDDPATGFGLPITP